MEEDVFVELYKIYAPYIYRYLYSLTGHHQTSEDLTQETFVRAMSVIQKPKETIKAWLLTVAHNLYVDYRKKSYRLDIKEQEFFYNASANDLEIDVVNRETQRNAIKMIRNLPEMQKQVVLLCIVNELPHKEVAKILGLSKSSITNLLYRARKSLKKWRKENG